MKNILVILLFVFVGLNATSQTTKVKLETTMGEVVIELYDKTPLHRDNFVKLVKQGFYDGLLFHRVISAFMCQAGDPLSKDCDSTKRLGSGDLGYTIPSEIIPGYFHQKGALCAARVGDQVNPQRRSSSCQFYIVVGKVWKMEELLAMRSAGFEFDDNQKIAYTTIGGTPHLDGQYTVFGMVVKGMEVVEEISNQPTRKGDRPIKDIKIIKATIL